MDAPGAGVLVPAWMSVRASKSGVVSLPGAFAMDVPAPSDATNSAAGRTGRSLRRATAGNRARLRVGFPPCRHLFWISVVACALAAAAGPLAPAVESDFLDAIYLAEGGARARVPYGVLSVTVRSKAQAREVAARVVRREWAVYSALHGRREDFATHFARRWAPLGASNDPTGLNRHLAGNIRHHFLRLSIRRLR